VQYVSGGGNGGNKIWVYTFAWNEERMLPSNLCPSALGVGGRSIPSVKATSLSPVPVATKEETSLDALVSHISAEKVVAQSTFISTSFFNYHGRVYIVVGRQRQVHLYVWIKSPQAFG